MTIPTHHKELYRHLREIFGEPANVSDFRDNSGKRPIPIGSFGPPTTLFHSTIGICDRQLKIPAGRYELAVMGSNEWLPNTLASSIYWLRDRSIKAWPMICEDTVRHNARSAYRHMAFVPSTHACAVSSGEPVHWLLGFPIKDSELTIDLHTARQKTVKLYPKWLEPDLPS